MVRKVVTFVMTKSNFSIRTVVNFNIKNGLTNSFPNRCEIFMYEFKKAKCPSVYFFIIQFFRIKIQVFFSHLNMKDFQRNDIINIIYYNSFIPIAKLSSSFFKLSFSKFAS